MGLPVEQRETPLPFEVILFFFKRMCCEVIVDTVLVWQKFVGCNVPQAEPHEQWG